MGKVQAQCQTSCVGKGGLILLLLHAYR